MGANQSTNKTKLENTARLKKKLLKALGASFGVVSHACKAAGVSRTQFYDWCSIDPAFNNAVVELKEGNKDFAEAMILKKIKDGDTTMIIFYAKTQMKDRGYVERQEFTGRDGQDLLRSFSRLSEADKESLADIGEKLLNDRGE